MRALRWSLLVTALTALAACIASCGDDGTEPTQTSVWRSSWSHPLPSGATIRGLGGWTEFDQWAVGDGGSIARYRGLGLTAVASPTTNTLRDVVAFSATQVFMVGDNGTIIGPGLTLQSSPTTNDLHSLFGFSASNLIAVGANGTIIQNDGGGWQSVTSPTSADLYGVWALANGERVAVGAGGVVIYSDGVAPWTVVPSFTSSDLNAVWADKPGDWFAVGDAGEIWQDRGAGWIPMTSPRSDDFYDVFGSDSAYVWAVGDADSILFYDQISWQPVRPNPSGHLDAIWATICAISLTSNERVSSTAHCSNTFFAGAGGVMARYTLFNTFELISSAETYADLRGVHGASGDVYAVGDDTTILRHDGSAWSSAINNVFSDNYHDVFVISPLDVVVVGASGEMDAGCVMEGADGSWEGFCYPGLPDLYGVWAQDATSVYMVGDAGGIFLYDRVNYDSPAEPAPLTDYRDVWGFSSGEPIAVGLGGVIVKRDAGTWSAMNEPVATDLFGVWGASETNAYAVGAGGVILHLDQSGDWQSMNSGVTDDIVAISGVNQNVWAVTNTGLALRLDGTTWRIEPSSGISGYGGVFVQSGSRVFGTGDVGGIIRFDYQAP